jgi:hypothetical protein
MNWRCQCHGIEFLKDVRPAGDTLQSTSSASTGLAVVLNRQGGLLPYQQVAAFRDGGFRATDPLPAMQTKLAAIETHPHIETSYRRSR